jgi:hypothetical protein
MKFTVPLRQKCVIPATIYVSQKIAASSKMNSKKSDLRQKLGRTHFRVPKSLPIPGAKLVDRE